MNMILFGAGSSVPFDIPGMAGFTEQFMEENSDISEFILTIRDAISKSEETIGVSFSFDLEALLSVLNDLSGTTKEKPISILTASVLLNQSLDLKGARKKFGDEASSTFDKLREFIFNRCMQPIKKGSQEGNYEFLDRFYGPLMTVLNAAGLTTIQGSTKKIYSTNWDLCFKTWVDYVNIAINDGIYIDKQGYPVLNVEKFHIDTDGFNYVPLHGSLDLIQISRPKGGGTYKDILKISDPIRYFEGQPANMRSVFMIFPLEAVGYEESIKSPYIDMLDAFRSSLRMESTVFVIGHSLRDPTIGSIFEEVLTERIRKGDLNLLSDDLDSRKDGVLKHALKIVVINPTPDKLIENLEKQSHTNLSQTFVPIRIEFPKLSDKDFSEKYANTLSQLIIELHDMDYLNPSNTQLIVAILEEKYGISKESLGRAGSDLDFQKLL